MTRSPVAVQFFCAMADEARDNATTAVNKRRGRAMVGEMARCPDATTRMVAVRGNGYNSGGGRECAVGQLWERDVL